MPDGVSLVVLAEFLAGVQELRIVDICVGLVEASERVSYAVYIRDDETAYPYEWMSPESWYWQELLLVKEGEDEFHKNTAKSYKDTLSLFEWNIVVLRCLNNRRKIPINKPLLLIRSKNGTRKGIGNQTNQLGSDKTWEDQRNSIASNRAKICEVVMWVITEVHDFAPHWNWLSPNSLGHIGNYLRAVHRSLLVLKLNKHWRLIWQILNYDLMPKI